MDPIVRQMIDEATANGPIMLRPWQVDREIIAGMIERSGLDRRTTMRPEADRRKADQ